VPNNLIVLHMVFTSVSAEVENKGQMMNIIRSSNIKQYLLTLDIQLDIL
jgi:hypothetical protein